jgi:hypothetical protein
MDARVQIDGESQQAKGGKVFRNIRMFSTLLFCLGSFNYCPWFSST